MSARARGRGSPVLSDVSSSSAHASAHVDTPPHPRRCVVNQRESGAALRMCIDAPCTPADAAATVLHMLDSHVPQPGYEYVPFRASQADAATYSQLRQEHADGLSLSPPIEAPWGSRFKFPSLVVAGPTVRAGTALDHFHALPYELQWYIFTFLPDERELCNAASVCRAWNHLTNDRILWRAICERKYGCQSDGRRMSMHPKNHVRYVGQRVLSEVPGRTDDSSLHRELRRAMMIPRGRNDGMDGHGGKEVLVSLIEHGRDVNTENAAGVRPLHLAAESGCLITVQMLVENGADVNAVDSNRLSALHLAASCGHHHVVYWLVTRAGACVDQVDQDHRTPLHWAAQFGHESIVNLLVECGADVSMANSTGNTALHFSALNGFLSACKTLVARGAPLMARNTHRETPALLAARNNKPHVHRWLIEQTRILDALASNVRPATLPLSGLGDEEALAAVRSAAAAATASSLTSPRRAYQAPVITRRSSTPAVGPAAPPLAAAAPPALAATAATATPTWPAAPPLPPPGTFAGRGRAPDAAAARPPPGTAASTAPALAGPATFAPAPPPDASATSERTLGSSGASTSFAPTAPSPSERTLGSSTSTHSTSSSSSTSVSSSSSSSSRRRRRSARRSRSDGAIPRSAFSTYSSSADRDGL